MDAFNVLADEAATLVVDVFVGGFFVCAFRRVGINNKTITKILIINLFSAETNFPNISLGIISNIHRAIRTLGQPTWSEDGLVWSGNIFFSCKAIGKYFPIAAWLSVFERNKCN